MRRRSTTAAPLAERALGGIDCGFGLSPDDTIIGAAGKAHCPPRLHQFGDQHGATIGVEPRIG